MPGGCHPGTRHPSPAHTSVFAPLATAEVSPKPHSPPVISCQHEAWGGDVAGLQECTGGGEGMSATGDHAGLQAEMEQLRHGVERQLNL